MNLSSLASRLHRGPASTLAIHCGDFRFQQAFHEFIAAGLKPGEAYDLMVLPGGPLSLTLQSSRGDETRAARKWAGFFVEKHGIQRVVLMQHQDCAWYQETSRGLRDPAALRRRQEQDLERAAAVLQESFPHLRVELYFAGWASDERVTVEPFRP